jgi:hypothetical protein
MAKPIASLADGLGPETTPGSVHSLVLGLYACRSLKSTAEVAAPPSIHGKKRVVCGDAFNVRQQDGGGASFSLFQGDGIGGRRGDGSGTAFKSKTGMSLICGLKAVLRGRQGLRQRTPCMPPLSQRIWTPMRYPGVHDTTENILDLNRCYEFVHARCMPTSASRKSKPGEREPHRCH